MGALALASRACPIDQTRGAAVAEIEVVLQKHPAAGNV